MRRADQIARLMKYDDTTRIFILDALEHIDGKIEQLIYCSDVDSDKDGIEIDWKSIIAAVFVVRSDKDGIVEWKGNKYHHIIFFKDIPNEIHSKSWFEIIESMKADPYKKTLITEWFEILKKELEIQGYEVGDIYPFKDPVLHIKWNNTIE